MSLHDELDGDHDGDHDGDTLDLALLEAALEEKLGGAAPPDLTDTILAAAARRGVRAEPEDSDEPAEAAVRSGWRWLALAAALVTCGAGVGLWLQWRARATRALPAAAPGQASVPGTISNLYRPRDLDDARAVLAKVDGIDVQFHTVGPHDLPTASVMGPPPPTLALGRWALGKTMAMRVRAQLEGAPRVDGFDPAGVRHSLYVHAGTDKRLHFSVMGDVVWIDGLGAFRADVQAAFAARLEETELETRRALGLVHARELGDGLPNDLIAASQATLRPFALAADDVGRLRGLTELRTLDLRWCPASATPRFLAEVRWPGPLELRLPGLDDAGLAALPQPLAALIVVGRDEAPWRPNLRPSCAGLTDAAARALLVRRTAGTLALRELVLPGCGMTRRGLGQLADLPGLESLVLTGARPEPGADVWDHFRSRPRGLTHLGLAHTSLAGPRDLQDLGALPALRELELDGCAAGATDARAQIAALADLARAVRLERLSLTAWFQPGCDREAARSALSGLAQAPALRWLTLADCSGLTADDLLLLKPAAHLDTLVLSGTAGEGEGLVRMEALTPLFDAHPNLTVILD